MVLLLLIGPNSTLWTQLTLFYGTGSFNWRLFHFSRCPDFALCTETQNLQDLHFPSLPLTSKYLFFLWSALWRNQCHKVLKGQMGSSGNADVTEFCGKTYWDPYKVNSPRWYQTPTLYRAALTLEHYISIEGTENASSFFCFLLYFLALFKWCTGSQVWNCTNLFLEKCEHTC